MNKQTTTRVPARLLTLLTPGSPGGWCFLPSPRDHQQEGSGGQGMMGGVCFPGFGGESKKVLLKIAGGVGCRGEHQQFLDLKRRFLETTLAITSSPLPSSERRP